MSSERLRYVSGTNHRPDGHRRWTQTWLRNDQGRVVSALSVFQCLETLWGRTVFELLWGIRSVPLAVANTLIPNAVFNTVFQPANPAINAPPNCAMSV